MDNKWIPCSEQIPEEPEENPLFDGKCLEVYLVTTKYGSSEQDKVYQIIFEILCGLIVNILYDYLKK